MTKSTLIICRKPPYGNSMAREAIDIALASCAFDIPVALLFMGEGVWQLKQQQDSQFLPQKNHGKALSALPLYGLDKIYVCEISLKQRQLSLEDLLLPATAVAGTELAALLNHYEVVLNF